PGRFFPTFVEPGASSGAIREQHWSRRLSLPPSSRATLMPAALACLPWLALLLAVPQTDAEKRSPGWDLWRQGQQAMQDGKTDRAIDLFEESIATDPKLTRNYLSLAACHLDRGDDAKACLHLMLYVSAHPEHRAVRFQHADLLQ